MKKKTAKKGTAEKNSPGVELSRRGVFLWLCLIFFVSAWMFVLGVLVGRDTAPVRFDIKALEKELMALKASVLEKERRWLSQEMDFEQKKTELEFYEDVTQEKSAARFALPPGDAPDDGTAADSEKDAPLQKKPKISLKKKSRAAVAPLPPPSSFYTVQVGSTKDPEAARRMAGTLRKLGHDAFTEKVQLPQKGTWYRVRVGRFDARSAADDARRRLAGQNYEGIVVYSD